MLLENREILTFINDLLDIGGEESIRFLDLVLDFVYVFFVSFSARVLGFNYSQKLNKDKEEYWYIKENTS